MEAKYKCVGCGHCCKTAPCVVSVAIYGPNTECPALKHDGKRYWCGVVKDMAIGEGCSSTLYNKDRELVIKESNEMLPIPADKIMVSFFKAYSGQLYSSEMLFLVFNSMKHDLIEKGYSEEDAVKTIEHIKMCMGMVRSQGVQNFMG